MIVKVNQVLIGPVLQQSRRDLLCFAPVLKAVPEKKKTAVSLVKHNYTVSTQVNIVLISVAVNELLQSYFSVFPLVFMMIIKKHDWFEAAYI